MNIKSTARKNVKRICKKILQQSQKSRSNQSTNKLTNSPDKSYDQKPSKTTLNKDNLEEFVKKSDSLSPAEKEKYWANKIYEPSFKIPETLDPFSKQYAKLQMKLYEEMSGRKYEDDECEQTELKVKDLVDKPNAYYGVNDSPGYASDHFSGIARLMSDLRPKKGAKVLELGAGWGFCAEFFATLGLEVTTVDINQEFVDLMNLRSKRLGYKNKSLKSTFETFDTKQKFDIIYFYESIHHSPEVYALLKRVQRFLKKDGSIILGAEPFSGDWPAWGMRLDPISVYCIKKFGWFESGWQRKYIEEIFHRSGMGTDYKNYGHNEYSHFLIASKTISTKSNSIDLIPWELSRSGWYTDSNEYIISKGKSSVDIPMDIHREKVRLNLSNFSGKTLDLEILRNSQTIKIVKLEPGANEIDLKLGPKELKLVFKSKTFNPAKDLGGSDSRDMSFHLKSITAIK